MLMASKLKKFLKKCIYKVFSVAIFSNFISLWRGPCSVLMFHRIHRNGNIQNNVDPNSGLSISEKNFDQILKNLTKKYEIIPIDKILFRLKKKSEKHCIVLTFDDGYLDNFELALPVLEKYNVPATIFITTRFLDGDCHMWWYELWNIIKKNETIEIIKKNKVNLWKCITFNQKLKCFKDLRKIIIKLNYKDQNKFLKEINQLKRPNFKNLCLNRDHILKLDQHPLITIGSHTHSHAVLSNETESFVGLEIKKSKEILEKIVGHEINYIAYPFGNLQEVNKREFEITKKLGYKLGFTTNCKKISIKDIYSLPRIAVNENNTFDELDLRINGLNNFFRKQFS